METTELTKTDSFIETELQRFEKIITKEQLITMADSVKDLVIKDTEDKAGLKAVIEGRKQLKRQRVAIQNEAKNIRESAVRFSKAVIAKESEFVALLEPVETILEEREANYYAERERLRVEEEKRESDRIQAMIDKLNAVRHAVDFHELKALTDVQFENLLAEATIKYNADLKAEEEERQRQYELRLQEETRFATGQKEQEERERKFKEQQEQVRIENERVQKEQDEKQRQMNEWNERIRKEQEAKDLELKKRQDELDRIEQLRIEEQRREKEFKEAEARKKQEEIDRKKREKEEQAEKLLYGEDTDRFSFHAGNLERNYIHGGGISGHMKSKKAKQVAAETDYLIRQAYEMCKANMGDKNRTPVPISGDNLD
jgi:hypothetical protein